MVDNDYDGQLTDDASSDVINDVSTGTLMSCRGLDEMPKYVPRGEATVRLVSMFSTL